MSSQVVNDIALSPNYATGLVVGVFLASMIGFAIVMMMSIQTSDKMALPASSYELPVKKVE